MELLIASGNPKKLVEIELFLSGSGVQLLSPSDVGGIEDVEEDRPTFEGNAIKKACAAASATGKWTLADDSGLEVDHLGGAPGVHSARYAGTHGDDDANNQRLLKELEAVKGSSRSARFSRCAAASRARSRLGSGTSANARCFPTLVTCSASTLISVQVNRRITSSVAVAVLNHRSEMESRWKKLGEMVRVQVKRRTVSCAMA